VTAPTPPMIAAPRAQEASAESFPEDGVGDSEAGVRGEPRERT
jgi:hypothetical protein